MGIQCTVIAKKVVTPDVVDELFAGEGDAPVAHQVEQKLILPRGKIDLFAIDIDKSSGKIDLQSLRFRMACTRIISSFGENGFVT